MEANALDALLKKSKIYYGDALISKETILQKYAKFFGEAIFAQKHNVSFALHTGSVCFDIISFVAATLGGIIYNLRTNDDILASLSIGDMVMFKNERYRWKGTTMIDGRLYIALEQDGRGRNGSSRNYVPYEQSKHMIKPYYGTSAKTDGRGVRRRKSGREEFISLICNLPESDVPVELDTSVVIVADRAEFSDICKKLRIVYGDGKELSILDIAPACYYTSSGSSFQFGVNPTKAEAVLKVAGTIGTARELVLERSGSKPVGLLVSGLVSLVDGGTELADLFRRRSLQFVHVSAPIRTELCENILELYDDASVFACTKEFLADNAGTVSSHNTLTDELYRQVMNVVNNEVIAVNIDGGISWNDYKQIRGSLSILKQSNWQSESKDDFILGAYGLLNLFVTAPFSMDCLDEAIASGSVRSSIIAPYTRIEQLRIIADSAGSMAEICSRIVDTLELQYCDFKEKSSKHDYIQEYMSRHQGSKIAIVLPKGYYADVIRNTSWFGALPETQQPILTTANRFDIAAEYDYVLVVGDFGSRKFNALQCYSAKEIDVLLYECESKTFRHKRNRVDRLSQRLNHRAYGRKDDLLEEIPDLYPAESEEIKSAISEFADLDQYIEGIGTFDIRSFASKAATAGGRNALSEVRYVGVFTTGEQILFSKFYEPVVFDANAGTVAETPVDKLTPGDLLVFTKRDDYTRNIVDYIYDQLVSSRRLNTQVADATEKAFYWKEALREYKERNGFSFRTIVRKLKEQGSSLTEVTVRQWLNEDGHIVGPRDKETFGYIANITQDPYLLAAPDSYFEACRIVRHERREILELIARAINDKLSGHMPTPGSAFEIVYENVENLSEIMEIDNLSCLDEAIYVPVNIINRPINESEAQL